jgi:hypothetical protein
LRRAGAGSAAMVAAWGGAPAGESCRRGEGSGRRRRMACREGGRCAERAMGGAGGPRSNCCSSPVARGADDRR